MTEFFGAASFSFFLFLIGVPVFMFFVRLGGLYAIVEERTAHVYVLFGSVVGVIEEPGLHFLPTRLGFSAFIVRWVGRRHIVDMSLHQEYQRSQAVNSEEGAPMGIGVWYEMFVSDPVGFLFKNADPRGSLRANVASAAVRCLSNMKLADMLEDPHFQERGLFEEVTLEDGSTVKLPTFAPKLSVTPGGTEWIGPTLGAHNQEVLGGLLGFSQQELEELAAAGVI